MLYLFCKKIFVCVDIFFFLYLLRIRVRISVEGFRCCKDDEDEIRIELINLFKSCGRDSIVDFPREPLLDRFVS